MCDFKKGDSVTLRPGIIQLAPDDLPLRDGPLYEGQVYTVEEVDSFGALFITCPSLNRRWWYHHSAFTHYNASSNSVNNLADDGYVIEV